MDEIRKQVAKARRRLVLQQFLGIVTWSLFATLLVAVVGLAIPRYWPLAIDSTTWDTSWIAGACGAGLVLAAIWTYLVRKASLDAAIEIDRRFGLKERVSSLLALRPSEIESEIGQALMDDAARRVSRIDIRDKFHVSLGVQGLWVLVPATAVFLLALLVPMAQQKKATAANSTNDQVKKQVQKSTDELKKRIEQQRELAEEKGLKEAENIFKKMTEGLDHLKDNQGLDRKNALVKLNNLAEDLQKRRNELGNAQQMKDQLKQLKDMQQGPADKMLNAMKQGDYGKAVDQLESLKDKIQKGELSEEEKKQLAKQLEAMKQKLEQMAADHEQTKQDLQRQIEQKRKEGDLTAAGKMQRQLDQLNQRDSQMERLSKLAEKLGKASDSMKEGDPQSASEQLSKLSSEMKQMKADLQEMESIDSVLDQIADAKDAMNCEECDGAGCEACQKDQFGNNAGKRMQQGDGNGGRGQGSGDRPEEETDTGFYESKVSAKAKQGQAVMTGNVAGPNRAGVTKEEIRAQIVSEVSKQHDPLTEQRLPRTQRQHTNEYMKNLREGK